LRNWKEEQQMGTTIARYLKTAGEALQKAGPYMLIEIILPGGTLIALLLFLCRRGDRSAASPALARARLLVDRVRARLWDLVLVLVPDDIATIVGNGEGGERDGLEPLAMGPSR
jgi:hypothetical protein